MDLAGIWDFDLKIKHVLTHFICLSKGQEDQEAMEMAEQILRISKQVVKTPFKC